MLKDEDSVVKRLAVYIEINGTNKYAGEIKGTDSNNACFTYAVLQMHSIRQKKNCCDRVFTRPKKSVK